MPMFSLKEISKIKNAKTSQEVLKFFNILDTAIPDNAEEKNNQNLSQNTNTTLMHTEIRKDEIENSKSEILHKNLPETQWEYLKA